MKTKIIFRTLLGTMIIVSTVSALSVLAEETTNPPAGQPQAESKGSEKRDAVVEKREMRQQKRIEQGVKSGKLTDAEAQKLETEQADIKAAETKAMQDGKMVKKEFRQIEKMQNKANRDIRREKHDRQREHKEHQEQNKNK